MPERMSSVCQMFKVGNYEGQWKSSCNKCQTLYHSLQTIKEMRVWAISNPFNLTSWDPKDT